MEDHRDGHQRTRHLRHHQSHRRHLDDRRSHRRHHRHRHLDDRRSHRRWDGHRSHRLGGRRSQGDPRRQASDDARHQAAAGSACPTGSSGHGAGAEGSACQSQRGAAWSAWADVQDRPPEGVAAHSVLPGPNHQQQEQPVGSSDAGPVRLAAVPPHHPQPSARQAGAVPVGSPPGSPAWRSSPSGEARQEHPRQSELAESRWTRSARPRRSAQQPWSPSLPWWPWWPSSPWAPSQAPQAGPRVATPLHRPSCGRGRLVRPRSRRSGS